MNKSLTLPRNISAFADGMKLTGVLLPCAVAGFLIFMLMNQSVLLGAAALLIVGCLALMLHWPDAGTMVILFVIYSNLGVLAMRSQNAVEVAAGSPDQNPRIAIVVGALSLLLLVPLVNQLFVRKQRLIFDHGFILMIGFLAASLASGLFARDAEIVGAKTADYLFEGLALYFLLTNVIRDLPTLRRAIWTLLLAGSLMAGLSVFQKVTHTEKRHYAGLAQIVTDFRTNPRMPNVEGRVRPASEVSENGEVMGQGRVAGPIGETNRYAQILLVLLPLAALLFRTESSSKLRVAAVVAGGLIAGGLLLTYSRGNLLAGVVVFGLMACLGLLKPRHVIVSTLAVGLLVGVFAPQVVSRMATLERLKALFFQTHETYQPPDSSAIRRYVENVAAWHVFLDHPVLGVGPGHFAGYYSNAYGSRIGLVEQTHNYRGHNLYLETLAETGVIGLACFLSILFVIMRELWKDRSCYLVSNPKLAFIAAGFFLSLTAYAVSAIFDHLSYQRYFWLLLALASAAVRIIHSESQSQEMVEPHLRPSEAP
jgi:putative inorganic carbon (hco3(-)) transporter